MTQFISFIGMSNVGKSFWSKRLKNAGYKVIGIDDVIEEKLEAVLKPLGYSGIHGVAEWMGQPYDERFAAAQERYLDLEAEAIQETLDFLEKTEEKVVIDTTGSFIYLKPELCEALKAKTTMVYLEASEAVEQELYRLYLENPKPVIWGDSFQPKEGESMKDVLTRELSRLHLKNPNLVIWGNSLNDEALEEELSRLHMSNPNLVIWGDSFKPEEGESMQAALARCYPLLLGYRRKGYERYAEVTLPYENMDWHASGQEFLARIEFHLRSNLSAT